MSYLSLLNYTKDVAESLSTDVLFVHGRKEVLHELREAPEINNTGIVFWSLPFISSGSFTEIGQQFNETVTINVIIYKQDALGSELDQDDPEEVQSEINVLAQTKDLADEFVRQFNFNTISIDAQEVSEELEIAGVDFDNVIKDNDYLLTGTFITINVQVPDQFNYCDVQFLTSVTYTNNFQDLDSSFATMVPTLLPSGATATYSADNLPSGLTLDANTGEVSEDDFNSIPDGLTTFFVSIEGTGSYGGSLAFQVVFCKPTSSGGNVTIENSDQSFDQTVPCGSSVLLNDVTITIDDGAIEVTQSTVPSAVDQTIDISSAIERIVLWMNQNTYDGLGSYDADTQYIIDDDLADGVIQTIYTAWST